MIVYATEDLLLDFVSSKHGIEISLYGVPVSPRPSHIYRRVPSAPYATNYNISCYTFASPRVGNPFFAAKFDLLIPDAWRVHAALDPAPLVPKFGYCHAGNEVVVTASGRFVRCGGSQISMDSRCWPLDSSGSVDESVDRKVRRGAFMHSRRP
jgi:hypothetical protein